MQYHFVDTHCHFDFPPFVDDAPSALYQAALAGVTNIIVPAVAVDRFEQILRLSQDYPAISAALGLHPLYIQRHDECALSQLDDTFRRFRSSVVAVGEIGLDGYMDNPHMEKQTALLNQQLELAKRYDLPVILHSRKTHDILSHYLKRADLPRCGVIHGFSGSLSQAQAFIRLGYAIGVGGVISYARAQKTRRVIAELPLNSLLLETDAPDMPLFGYQGQPNRPERIRQVFDVLCLLRAEPAEVIAEQIYQNTQRIFTLSGQEATPRVG